MSCSGEPSDDLPLVCAGLARLYHADCFAWLAARAPASIHAVVTDPPYGLVEYSAREQDKLRRGKGGVWRIPPAFDGQRRAPLPRFTVLDADDRADLHAFFTRLDGLLLRVLVPGGNVLVASNPLLSHCDAGRPAAFAARPRAPARRWRRRTRLATPAAAANAIRRSFGWR